MRNFSLLAIGLAYSPVLSLGKRIAADDISDYAAVFNNEEDSVVTCYEYVQSITYVGAPVVKTITKTYTGPGSITEPQTSIIVDEDGDEATVVVEVPPPPVSSHPVVGAHPPPPPPPPLEPTTETLTETFTFTSTRPETTFTETETLTETFTFTSTRPESTETETETLEETTTFTSTSPETTFTETETEEETTTFTTTLPETTFTETETTTETSTLTSTSPGTTLTETETTTETSTESPGPTFSCDAGGYLIQQSTLYRLDLLTGENVVVNKRVGPGGNINGLGYNILDNYLYAFVTIPNSGQQQLIRIDAKGNGELLPLKVAGGLNVADCDDNGQLWVSARGSRWAQVDLKPGSATYGQVVDEGTSKPSVNVADWVYLENGGDYLYSIKIGANAVSVRWSRTTHQWETLEDYGPVTGTNGGYGALYAVGDEVWGSDNQSGKIVEFPVLATSADDTAEEISDGPKTSSNDGARCFKAPPP